VRNPGKEMILMKYLLVLIASSILSHAVHGNSAYINEILDFTQTDVRGEKNGNGQQHCAPVAVSNSLMWLGQKQTGQLQLIEKLASSRAVIFQRLRANNTNS
jgi:hypothetical protein